MVDAKKIEELRELLAKATPGPWSATEKDGRFLFKIMSSSVYVAETSWHEASPIFPTKDGSKANFDLIVAMRNTLPALLDLASEALASRAQVGAAEGLCKRFEANPPVDPVDITRALRDWALALGKPGTALLKDLTQAAFLIEFITKERAEAAALIRSLSSRVEAAERGRERLKYRLDLSLNDHLVEMREGYDDSITGFNAALDVVRSVFADMERTNAGK